MNDPISDHPIIVLITAPSREVGKKIADDLLEGRLAACVNIVAPINSLYLWQGEKNDEEEVLLIVKTRRRLFEDRLVPAVLAAHPYETPEIIALPIIAGHAAYLNWIDRETRT